MPIDTSNAQERWKVVFRLTCTSADLSPLLPAAPSRVHHDTVLLSSHPRHTQNMPRAPKYATDAERLQARRSSRRKYYYKCVVYAGQHTCTDGCSNLEREREKALERVRSARLMHGRSVTEGLSAQETLLPATSAVRITLLCTRP